MQEYIVEARPLAHNGAERHPGPLGLAEHGGDRRGVACYVEPEAMGLAVDRQYLGARRERLLQRSHARRARPRVRLARLSRALVSPPVSRTLRRKLQADRLVPMGPL